MLKLCVLALMVAYAYAGEDDGFCVCRAYGKYHYQTFDGAFIRFDGQCGYTLSESKPNANEKFRINIYNKGDKDQYERIIAIKLGANLLRIEKGIVSLNRVAKTLPFTGTGGINVSMEGKDIKVYLAWMLTILFDGKQKITIKVPESYSNKMYGICGDCNKNATDDFRAKKAKVAMGKSITAPVKVAKSYIITLGQTCPVNPVVSKCPANNKCFKMWADTFKQCQKAIGSKKVFEFMESCKVDVCMSSEQTKAMCIAYERLEQECMRRNIFMSWKAIVGCETPCDKTPCKNGGNCTVTTTKSNYTCKCTENFVGENCEDMNPCTRNTCKNNGTCIPNASTRMYKCNCTDNFLGDNCETDNPCLTTPCKNGGTCVTSGMPVGDYNCTCTQKYFGTTCEKENKCANNPCGDNGNCTNNNGGFICACKQGYVGNLCDKDSPCKSGPCKNGGTCEVSGSRFKCMCQPAFLGSRCQHQWPDCVCRVFGDPHYITFDNQAIHFMGKCKYTLTASKKSSKEPQFSVEVKNHHRGNTRVSYTRIVDVKVNGNTFRMLPGNKLMVNDENIILPMSNYTQVFASYSLGWVTLRTTFGLKVEFDGVHRVIVTVTSLYMKQLTGICGDCNRKKDDYKTKSGDDVSSSTNKFSLIGASYQVVDDSDKPETNCTVVDYDSASCPPSKFKKCYVLNDFTGPFTKCLKGYVVPHQHYIDSCKMDLCAYRDDASMTAKLICQVYEAFAKHCDITGAFADWRKEAGCEKKCRTNEKYSAKAAVCQENCIGAPTLCLPGSSEGCTCKSGYTLMGDTCVTLDKCGCNYKGITAQLNTAFVTPDCSETIKCESDRKVTKNPGCKKNEDCLLQSGKRVCQCPPAFKKDQNKCLVPTFPEDVMTAALTKFVRVSMAYINGTALKTTSTNRPEVCAVICDNTTECKSFNFDEMKDECNLFSVNAVNNTLVTVNCPFQDYYQLIESKEIVIRGGTIFPCGPLIEFAVVNTLGDCKAKCKKNNCKSMEYSLVNKECSVTNSTGKDFEINGDSEFVYYGNLD